jgi:Transcriptional regulator, AbiEi antitoxin
MDLEQLMADQAGVVSRRQVLARGLTDNDIERRLRRREWARVHRGVYVDHTGPLSWAQRLWAAVLFYDRAAACDESALSLFGVRPAGLADQVHVAVDRDRRVVRLPDVRVHRMTDLDRALHGQRWPPRVRLERAVLQVAGRARDEASAVAVLADACRSRRTTAARLRGELAGLSRLRHRAFLLEVLSDVADGVQSVLEHRYLTLVERPHGLPRGTRQRRIQVGGQVRYRDVEYLGGLIVVELDGRLGHDGTAERWADLDRDVDSAMEGATTVRLGWRQVLDPCRIAAAVARLLWACGWQGRPRSCGPGCSMERWLRRSA